MSFRRATACLLLIAFISCSAISPGSVAAQRRVAPVVDMEGGCIMGGWRGGRWLDAKQTAAALRGGERYNIYTATRKVGTRTGPKPTQGGEPCTFNMDVTMESFTADEYEIAVGGDWNALPRVPRFESTASPVYRAAVARVLRGYGVRQPDVKLTEVMRVDLDGDGREEVLINATRLKRYESGAITPEFDAGDYSLVLLRKVSGGKVQTTLLALDLHLKAGTQMDSGPPTEYTLISALDLNGDGRMEIIIKGAYYEGDEKLVYEFKGGRVRELKNVGCGCGA